MTDYVNSIRNETFENARKLLNFDIPNKILVLEELHTKLDCRPVESFLTPLQSEKCGLDTSVNKNFVKIRDELKTHMEEIIDWMFTLSMCITLRVPKIEDGNNFGVNVQGVIRDYITNVRTQSLDFVKSSASFHSGRGKLFSKCVKYPGVEDYTHCMTSSDVLQHTHLLRGVLDMRNSLVWIRDLCVKNWGKLMDPRGSNGNLKNLNLDAVPISMQS